MVMFDCSNGIDGHLRNIHLIRMENILFYLHYIRRGPLNFPYWHHEGSEAEGSNAFKRNQKNQNPNISSFKTLKYHKMAYFYLWYSHVVLEKAPH